MNHYQRMAEMFHLLVLRGLKLDELDDMIEMAKRAIGNMSWCEKCGFDHIIWPHGIDRAGRFVYLCSTCDTEWSEPRL